MRRICGNCGYCKQGACASYISPMRGIIVKPGFSCEHHRTALECEVDRICGTSVDDARYSVEHADIETLTACLEREKRKTLRRVIESRIKKLNKTAKEAQS